MDEFLRDIHVEIYKAWVIGQLKQEGFSYRQETFEDELSFVIDTEATESKMTFFPECLIELVITNKKNGNPEFYLHFRLETLPHATGLFREFVETIKKIDSQKTIKVLLSCSSGLTTSFFAENLNEGAQQSGIDFEFSAVAYSQLPSVNDQGVYDIILLAPQISYQLSRVQSIFHRIPVLALPSALFAKYDVTGTISLIREALKEDLAQDEIHTQEVLSLKHSIDYKERILVIGVLNSIRHVRIVYRVYYHEDILYFGEVVKSELHMRDIDDIITMAMLDQPQIKAVGIAVPGVVENGRVYFGDHSNGWDVVEWLKGRHPGIRFYIHNDVNAIAAGIYSVQDKYQSLSFYFLPRGFARGGVGSVFKGQLLNGSHQYAGEVAHLPLAFTANPRELVISEEGAVEVVAKHIACISAFLDPELIAYYCSNVPSVDDLKMELGKYVPDKYMPVITKVHNLQEYIIFGEMILSIMQEEAQ